MLIGKRKAKQSLKLAERMELGIKDKLYFEYKDIEWHFDGTRAQRVPLCHMQKGDRFRLLNEHGKPYGPRYTVTFDMDDFNKKYGDKAFLQLIVDCPMIFKKDGDDRDYKTNKFFATVIVKPIHGNSLLVDAKLRGLVVEE